MARISRIRALEAERDTWRAAAEHADTECAQWKAIAVEAVELAKHARRAADLATAAAERAQAEAARSRFEAERANVEAATWANDAITSALRRRGTLPEPN